MKLRWRPQACLNTHYSSLFISIHRPLREASAALAVARFSMNRNSQLPLIDELPPTVPNPHFPQLFSYPVCRIDSPHDQGCLRNNKAKAAPAATKTRTTSNNNILNMLIINNRSRNWKWHRNSNISKKQQPTTAIKRNTSKVQPQTSAARSKPMVQASEKN